LMAKCVDLFLPVTAHCATRAIWSTQVSQKLKRRDMIVLCFRFCSLYPDVKDRRRFLRLPHGWTRGARSNLTKLSRPSQGKVSTFFSLFAPAWRLSFPMDRSGEWFASPSSKRTDVAL